MNSNVERIKDRISIIDVISSYIKVEKSGKNFKACCPFHNEKTPSFFISPDRGTYYCFGCGKKGDIFSFVQEFEGIDFVSSLKILADKAGITLVNEKSGDRSEREKGFLALDTAANFFEQNLSKDSVAKDYLKNRSVNEDTIKKWRIGSVGNNWSDLRNYLKQLGFEDSLSEQVGLIKKSDKGDYYDRFRGRVMFPLFNSVGKVVGFTGRILIKDDKQAKYVNSPETPYFSKSNILYGLNFAKSSIRKNNFSILVEGQFDVIMAHQMGYTNTIATSGTALTDEQLTQLSRLSSRLVIALDADSAGFKASERAWQLALQKGMDVKIARLPKGKDPADLAKENPEEWKKSIRESSHIVDFLVDEIASKNLDRRNLAIEIHRNVMPYVNKIESTIERSHFVEKISNKFGIQQEVIWQEIVNSPTSIKIDESQKLSQNNFSSDKKSIIDQIIGIIFWQKSKDVPDINLNLLESKFKELVGENEITLFERNPNIDSIIFATESIYSDVNILKRTIEELLLRLEKNILETKRNDTKNSLKIAENSGNHELQDKLLLELQEISKSIESLGTKIVDINQ